MTMPTVRALRVACSEPRTRRSLVFEMIALRHQIAILKRSQTRRPCFRPWDRMFWILLSWWWPGWRESLLIVQPETVLRWSRNGWSVLWRDRSRGRWRGGRPRVSREVRTLIARMVRENFLWGAPRLHGELLMLGFQVSQATVSRYLATLHRRPGQSRRTFIRNQTIAFRDYEHPHQQSDEEPLSMWETCRVTRSVAQVASLNWVSGRWHVRRALIPRPRRIASRRGVPARRALHCVFRCEARVHSCKAHDRYLGPAAPMRSPPCQARASPSRARSRTKY